MKKILLGLLSVLVVLSIFACAKKEKASTNDSLNNAKQKLIMCTNAEFPPYEFKDGGEFKGVDVECAKKIGEKLGREVEILDIAFDSLIPAVMSGKADFAMAGMTVTEDRKQNVDFSTTYQKAVQAIVVPKDSAIKSVDDLKGIKVGVQTGTTGDIYVSGDLGDDSVERYAKIQDGMQALKAGKIDAIVIDDQVAKALVESVGDGFVILDTPYAEEEYAIAVKKGNTELLNKVNAAIEEMKTNGELKAIVDKYIH